MNILIYLILIISFSFSRSDCIAATKGFILDSFKISGTQRLEEDFLRVELGLEKGSEINPKTIEDIQVKLYGLGLFKSVIVSLEKTKERGKVNLNIDIEDDPSVIGSWALGGTLKLTHGEPTTQTLVEDQPPLGFQGELISRNLFNSLHRGEILIDIDSQGIYRNIKASYGFPRFSDEGVQFDANIRVTDVEQRYWDALGFGSEGSAIWSYDLGFGTFKYGLAILTNRPPRFTVPGFPKSIVGPQFTFEYETRLLRFVPTPGYRIQPSLLLPPGNYEQSVFRLDLGSTHSFIGSTLLSFDGTIQTVGKEGISGRFSSQLDIPLDQNQDQGTLYFNYKQGFDRFDDQKIWGRSATIGIRYHSFGFIAELALKITDAPNLSELNQREGFYE